MSDDNVIPFGNARKRRQRVPDNETIDDDDDAGRDEIEEGPFPVAAIDGFHAVSILHFFWQEADFELFGELPDRESLARSFDLPRTLLNATIRFLCQRRILERRGKCERALRLNPRWMPTIYTPRFNVEQYHAMGWHDAGHGQPLNRLPNLTPVPAPLFHLFWPGLRYKRRSGEANGPPMIALWLDPKWGTPEWENGRDRPAPRPATLEPPCRNKVIYYSSEPCRYGSVTRYGKNKA